MSSAPASLACSTTRCMAPTATANLLAGPPSIAFHNTIAPARTGELRHVLAAGASSRIEARKECDSGRRGRWRLIGADGKESFAFGCLCEPLIERHERKGCRMVLGRY